MPNMLVIVSKAIFDKEGRRLDGTPLRIGDIYQTDTYSSKNPVLTGLASGGDLFLVTAKPDDKLWLVGLLHNLTFKGVGWFATTKNTIPVTDITALIPKFKFTTGKGIQAAPGKLGMSLQTPRTLIDEDIALLRIVIGKTGTSSPTVIKDGADKKGREINPGMISYKGVDFFAHNVAELKRKDWQVMKFDDAVMQESFSCENTIITDLYFKIAPFSQQHPEDLEYAVDRYNELNGTSMSIPKGKEVSLKSLPVKVKNMISKELDEDSNYLERIYLCNSKGERVSIKMAYHEPLKPVSRAIDVSIGRLYRNNAVFLVDYFKRAVIEGRMNWKDLGIKVFERGSMNLSDVKRITGELMVTTQNTAHEKGMKSVQKALETVVPACANCDGMLICRSNLQETNLPTCPYCNQKLEWYFRFAKVHDASIPGEKDAWTSGMYNFPIKYHGRLIDIIPTSKTMPIERVAFDADDATEETLYCFQEALPNKMLGPFAAILSGPVLKSKFSIPFCIIAAWFPQKANGTVYMKNESIVPFTYPYPDDSKYNPSIPMTDRIKESMQIPAVRAYYEDKNTKITQENTALMERAKKFKDSISINEKITEDMKGKPRSDVYLKLNSIIQTSKQSRISVKLLNSEGHYAFKNFVIELSQDALLDLVLAVLQYLAVLNPNMELFAAELDQSIAILAEAPGKSITLPKNIKVKACKHCNAMFLKYRLDWNYEVNDFLSPNCPYCMKPREEIVRMRNVVRVKLDHTFLDYTKETAGNILGVVYNGKRVRIRIPFKQFYYILEHLETQFKDARIGPLVVIHPTFNTPLEGLTILDALVELEYRPATLFPEDLIAY